MIPHIDAMLLVGGGDPDAQALFARMSPTPGAARKKIITDMIKALKTAGVWDRLDALWVLAAHSQQAALLNWKSTSWNASIVGGSITVDRGLSRGADPQTAYIDTNYAPVASGRKFTQADGHIAGFLGKVGGANSGYVINQYEGGNSDKPGASFISVNGLNQTTATMSAQINAHGSNQLLFPQENESFFLTSNSGDGVNRKYANGQSNTYGQTTEMPANKTFLLGAFYDGSDGSIQKYGAYTSQRAASVGASLTDSQVAAYRTALRTYLQNVGIVDA